MGTHKTRLRRRRMMERLRRIYGRLSALLILSMATYILLTLPAAENTRFKQLMLSGQKIATDLWGKLSKLYPSSDSTDSTEDESDSEPTESIEHMESGSLQPLTESVSAVSIAALMRTDKPQSAPADTVLAAPETLLFKNTTRYNIDPAAIMLASDGITLDSSGPQVLVIHTHASEAYTQEDGDTYTESDPYRTEDNSHNMIRVGDELCHVLESHGIATVHDETLFDYPNYNGSYTRALEAIEKWLAEYPSIKVVLDLHRDAIEYSDGSAYKTEYTVNGENMAQVLIISGTDDSGLYDPRWQENLAFGFTLQARMDAEYPGLTRPLKISQYRYNMHATTGSLLIEVGSHGNTLQEALAAVRLFANSLADVLLAE